MADDLNDEWWLNQQQEENEHKPSDAGILVLSESELAEEEGRSCKRKSEEGQKESKKKRKRKKITDELKQTGIKSGEPLDLMMALKKNFENKLSASEWDEVSLEEDHFFECNTDSLQPSIYLKQILPKWQKMLKKKKDLKPGSPMILVVASSAVRSVELIREINSFKGDNAKTAKLFAKHFKIEDHKKFLKKAVIQIGVGTPNRLNALLNSGALKLKSLNALILDWNWRDVKSHRLIDIPEVRTDLMSLFRTFFSKQVKDRQCQIGLL